jgi:hypothetical protein
MIDKDLMIASRRGVYVVWLTENDWSGSFKSQTLAMIPKNR